MQDDRAEAEGVNWPPVTVKVKVSPSMKDGANVVLKVRTAEALTVVGVVEIETVID